MLGAGGGAAMKRIYPIDIFPWGHPEVYPESQAELEFLDDGIFVCLSAKEKNPRCSVTFPGGEVYRDSCMEFFFCPCPERNPGYFNFETNALGMLYVGFSPDGTRRMSAPIAPAEYTGRIPTDACIDRSGGSWSVRFTISYDFIRSRVPEFNEKRQKHITGNFYKCGDCTEYPHYAVWHPIDSNIITKPDFHVAKYFGTIEIE